MHGGRIMWLENDEIKLLDSIFESETMIPKNRKGGYKLRHISFFMSNMKAITNVCKSLERFSMKEKLPHQYVEVLRKMGLVNKKEKITKYGEMLLKIMYFENNRIIDEFNKTNVTIEDLPEDISFVIEFFLFAVVKKCLDDKEECERCEIEYDDLAAEPLDSIKYFFSNIIDTLKEPTNKNTNLNELFSFKNDDFYYTIQGMNFSGYEVKRLFRLSKEDIVKAWRTYEKVLETVKSVDRSKLRPEEIRYYEYAMYYIRLVQKDVRNRVKHSVFNYILLNSIEAHRNRIKIRKHPDFDLILSYHFIEEMYDKYKLRDVYNLVYFERDSKYITNIVKPLVIGYSLIHDLGSEGTFDIQEIQMRQQHINLGDEVMFVDDKLTKILKAHVYRISKIKKVGSNLNVGVTKKEEINMVKESEILNKFKEA